MARLDLTEKDGWLERPEPVVIPAENGLELTEIRDDDFDAIEELYEVINRNRQHIGEFAKGIKSEADLIRRIHAYNRLRALQLVIRRKDGGRIIGEATSWDNEDARWDDAASLWLSYWIDEAHTGQGNAPAAIRALAGYSFMSEPGVERILASVKADSVGPSGQQVPGNRASMSVLTKAGFKFVRTVENTAVGLASLYELRRSSLNDPIAESADLDQGV